MEVHLARSAGFCFGVRRAVEMTEEAVGAGKAPAMLGSVIHNAQVIDALCAAGARLIHSPREAKEGEWVVIRAHGEGEATYRLLSERNCRVLDGTCPHVRRIQDIPLALDLASLRHSSHSFYLQYISSVYLTKGISRLRELPHDTTGVLPCQHLWGIFFI